MQYLHPEMGNAGEGQVAAEGGDVPGEPSSAGDRQPFVRQSRKVGRNEPCPCGSGKKFKHCHGRLNA